MSLETHKTPQYMRVISFLPQSERDTIFNYAVANEYRFQSSTVTTNVADYRKSSVLHYFPEIENLVVSKVRQSVPEWCDRLGIPRFEIGQIECQLTRTGNGEYFKRHTDNGCPATATRVLTYVYHFFSPNAFTGGGLRFYEYPGSSNFTTLLPVDNAIFVFPSSTEHEVLPTETRLNTWECGRFSVNGWVRHT